MPDTNQYILFESAAGFGLFELTEYEELAALKAQVQNSVTDLGRFSKLVKLKAFRVSAIRGRLVRRVRCRDVSPFLVGWILRWMLDQQVACCPQAVTRVIRSE